jgi:signal transduction histidine kinase
LYPFGFRNGGKQIVLMHGGCIWVESTLGKGSTFQMELPIRAEFRQTMA